MGGGLLRYEGLYFTHNPDVESEHQVISAHRFTIVKPMNSVTREVKAWEKYRLRIWESDRSKNCISFKREVFKLMVYEPTLTVLYG